jgi:tetraacyldisaccharide 4'-kinase
LHSEQFEVPVVSVGNLAVGGTGKTPTVDYIAKHYLARGKRVAVVSRGYGGRGAGEVGIVSDGKQLLLSADLAGDEPRLLAQRNPDLIVLVAPRRVLGVRAAIDRFGAEIIILDDGFQHLAVQRDLDIVLLDARRPFGNGSLLPAGLLREFPWALKRGDLFMLTKAVAGNFPRPAMPGPALISRYLLADTVVALGGQVRELASLRSQRVAAFAGIADPESFFADLRGKGLNLVATAAFSDHVSYQHPEMARIAAFSRVADCLLTTEKDAVKLTQTELAVPCYSVPLELVFDDRALLISHLDRLLAKESPMAINQALLDILACPKCKGELRLRNDQSALLCDSCRLAYPIRENIPVMLIDEAESIGEE